MLDWINLCCQYVRLPKTGLFFTAKNIEIFMGFYFHILVMLSIEIVLN